MVFFRLQKKIPLLGHMPHQEKTYTTNYIPAFQKLVVELV